MAKVLAFVFFVVLAHAVTPAEYGIFRFSLTLSYLGSVPSAAFALTLTHYLASRGSTTDTRPVAAVMKQSLLGSTAGMFVALSACPMASRS